MQATQLLPLYMSHIPNRKILQDLQRKYFLAHKLPQFMSRGASYRVLSSKFQFGTILQLGTEHMGNLKEYKNFKMGLQYER